MCCGLHRQKEIHCPPKCPFLVKHKSYQDKRALKKNHSTHPFPPPSGKDILSDERLAWLAFNIEVPIGRMAEKDSSMTDGDALLALDYVRNKLEKETRLIIMAEHNVAPKNEMGEAILRSVEQCRYEKKIIIPGEFQNYQRDEKIKCLDRVIFAAKQISGDAMEGREYLQRLLDRFSKISELSRQQKLHSPD